MRNAVITAAEIAAFRVRFPDMSTSDIVDAIFLVKENDPLVAWMANNLLTDSQLDTVYPRASATIREML